jgi:hypothetical protein
MALQRNDKLAMGHFAFLSCSKLSLFVEQLEQRVKWKNPTATPDEWRDR